MGSYIGASQRKHRHRKKMDAGTRMGLLAMFVGLPILVVGMGWSLQQTDLASFALGMFASVLGALAALYISERFASRPKF